ncbi:MAG TPA: S46 family peptidase, partial [Polyangiaceae bacterium]|nr:S46 family peptidase [Polyangiaceae bacterium]
MISHRVLGVGALCVVGVVLGACRPPRAAPTTPAAAPQVPQAPSRGGMWLPEQMTAHAGHLQQLGLKLDPKALTDPTAYPLAAVVSLGGCSASFVSPDGLIVTNHHCAIPALQYNSVPGRDLAHTGFTAKDRASERSNGPTARVFVTQKQTDITQQMTQGLASIADDRARFLESEKRSKFWVQSCEQQTPNVRCQVSSVFGGAQYLLIESLEIKDVRLVHAPADGIGNFGGEIDNWQWPRHAGDYAFFRAYVGKDGKPAEYASDNVPYHPPHHLKLSQRPLHEGDLVFVAGYPGHTEQLATPMEIDELVNWSMPRQIRYCQDNVTAIERAVKGDAAATLKGYPPIRGLNNRKKATEGSLDGLGRGGVAQQKRQQYAAFYSWLQKRDAAQLKMLDDFKKLLDQRFATRARRANLDEILQASQLLHGAIQIVRLAKERSKPDTDRKPAFQERNVPMIRAGLEALDQRYSQKIDVARLMLALDRVATEPLTDRPAAFKTLGGELVQPKARLKNVTNLFVGSTLPSKAARLKLLTSDWGKIEKHWDPLLKATRELVTEIEQREAEDEAFEGRMLLLRPKVISLFRQFLAHPVAPDANRTLRITYGTVTGYSPAAGRPPFPAFTRLREVVAKHTGKDPFIAPKALLEKIKAGQL